MNIRKTALENPTLALVLFFLLVLLGPLGSISATFGQLALLVAAPLVFKNYGLSGIRQQPVLISQLTALSALGVAFALSAQDLLSSLHVLNFLAVVLCLPLFLLACRVEHKELWCLIANAALIGLTLTLAVSLFQVVIQGSPRALGFASNENIIARFALIAGFVSLVGYMVAEPPRRLVYLLGPVLGISICLLSQSRGAFLALPVLLFVSGAFLLGGLAKQIGRMQAILIVCVAAILLMFVLILMSSRVSELGSVLSNVLAGQSGGEAVDVRVDLYFSSWKALWAQPFFGHGWQNMVHVANEALSDSARTQSLLGYRHLHSDFLNFGVGAGLIGVLVWLTFLFAPFYWALHNVKGAQNEPARYVLVLLPATVFVFGLTDMSLGYDVITVTYFGLIALALAGVRPAPEL